MIDGDGRLIMTVDKLDTVDVYWCSVTSGMTINYSWVVMSKHTRDAVIIDPAWELSKITRLISANSLHLRAVLVTHHHHDHIHLAQSVSDLYGIPVYISRAEIEFYRLNKDKFTAFDDMQVLPGISPDVTALVTPGHTAGSACFRIGNALFTGDTVFNEGCGMCVGPGASASMLFESLQRLKKIVSSDVRIYPGHRYLTELGDSWESLMKMNIYLNIEDKQKFIHFRMRSESLRNSFHFI
jgi:glyoxylase-like metal-dependent hydrolase (beta-lactamase superfamily II)